MRRFFNAPFDLDANLMLTAAALALQKLLVRRRNLSGVLLNADAAERWGPKEGSAFDAMMAEASAVQREHGEVSEALATLARETWARDQHAMVAWANAHIALLERFVVDGGEIEAKSTARFVAENEIKAWHRVALGELGYVDENGFYVHVDAAAHAAYFGAL